MPEWVEPWLWAGLWWFLAALAFGLFAGRVMHAGSGDPEYPTPANDRGAS